MGTHRGPTLAERSAASGLTPPPAPPPRRRHCWVQNPSGSRAPCPGLVLEWKRAPDGGWLALTAYVVDDGQDLVLVQGWLHAALLRPA